MAFPYPHSLTPGLAGRVRRALAALAVLASPSLAAAPKPIAIETIQPLDGVLGGLAFDSAHTYLSTSKGAYRTASPLTARSNWDALDLGECALGQPAGAAMAGQRFTRLYAGAGALYAANEVTEEAEGAPREHALCRSTDNGRSFTAIDADLYECIGSFCRYFGGEDLEFYGDNLYTNAGGGRNVLVSSDGGGHWRAVVGSLHQQACYMPAFEIIGTRLLIGGECPLDSAYIEDYALREDRLSLAEPGPRRVATPPLANRNVQFIERQPGTGHVYAGVEGGLLRSATGGKSFRFAIKYSQGGAAKYPYIKQIAFSSKQPGVVVVGGFDNIKQRPYLAYSRDHGRTWLDISKRLPRFAEAAKRGGAVNLLKEAPDGRLLVGVTIGEINAGTGHTGYLAAIQAKGL